MKKLFTILCATVISSSAFAQIPNPGFETWDATGSYNRLVGWDSPDSITSSFSVYPCSQGTPGAVGASYVKLVSSTVLTYVAPGLAVSGKIDFATMTPSSGFAYSLRPANLTGSWQYMASGADQGHIVVMLTKWNTTTSSRDTISFTDYSLPGMVMSWATFSIPLTYQNGAFPDSGLVLLSSSGASPVAGSYLYVDDLAFTGAVTAGVNEMTNQSAISVYPNPARAATTLTYNSATGTSIKVSINDMSGRNVATLTPAVVAGKNKLPIDVSGFPKGMYIVRIIDGNNTEVQKLIVE